MKTKRLYTWLRVTSLPERIANLARMHGHPHRLHLIDNNLVFKKFCAAKNRRLEFPSLGYEDLDIEEEEKGGKVIFCLTFFLETKLLYTGCAKMRLFLFASNFFIFHAIEKFCTLIQSCGSDNSNNNE